MSTILPCTLSLKNIDHHQLSMCQEIYNDSIAQSNSPAKPIMDLQHWRKRMILRLRCEGILARALIDRPHLAFL